MLTKRTAVSGNEIGHKKEETVPHSLCQCSAIAQSLYKARHDHMLCPIYHQIISLYGFTEDQMLSQKQPMPKPLVESERAKILWHISIYLDVTPENGAKFNKPDIMVHDKEKETWIIIVEGTLCRTGSTH